MNVKRWKAWGLGLVLAATLSACASGGVPGLPPTQTYFVSGSVQGEDGAAWNFASVVLEGSPRGSVTDDQGRFGIEALRPGAYGLTVVYLGYRSEPARLRVPGSRDTTVTLTMVRDPRLGPALADSLAPVRVRYSVRKAG